MRRPYIYTGRGESMFHIFPDGTSLLLDVGDSTRFQGTPAEGQKGQSPSLSNGKCTVGEGA